MIEMPTCNYKRVASNLPARNLVQMALSVLFCLILVGIIGYNTPGIAFAGEIRDIGDHWAAADIQKAISAGYVKGYPEGVFRPDAGVTRAELVAMMDGAFQVAVGPSENAFKDVRGGEWFAQGVYSALASGYVNGYPDGTFRPQDAVSRQEAACMLAKLLQLDGQEDLSFSDALQIDSWARPSVSGLVYREIMAGYPEGVFRPDRVISRAEAVVVINKAMSLQSPTPVTSQLQVAKDTVNVRSGHGQNESLIGQVHFGDVLQAKAKSGNDWYQIDYQGGTGWIADWCVQIYQPVVQASPPSGAVSGEGAQQLAGLPAKDDATDGKTFYGLDVSQYPGDDLMQAWWNSSPFYYTGFYLGPTWEHPDTSWMDKRQVLVDQGWGFMPIYVGLQAGSSNLNAAAGTSDADDAINLAASAGFPGQTTIFLDVETSVPLAGDYLAYINAWVKEVESKNAPGNPGYQAGIYCYIDNAAQIRNALSRDVDIWVASWLAHGTAYSLSRSTALDPADSGVSFAKEWQFVGDVSMTYGGYPVTVDLSTSIYPDPSMPSRKAVQKNP